MGQPFPDTVLIMERPGGWPAAAGRLCLLLGLLVLGAAMVLPAPPHVRGQVDVQAYWLEVAVLCLLGALFLLLWRRGSLVDLATGTLTHWWGVAFVGRPILLRRGPPRSLRGYTGVRVVRSDTTEHYKRFRHPVYHVQLEKSASTAGQLALRERIIADDEIRDPHEAGRIGRRLADFLSLDLIDRTA